MTPNVVVAGIIAALLTTINAIAYASLIYSGPLADGLPLATATILAGAAVGGLVLVLGTSQPGVMAAPIGATAVAYMLIADNAVPLLPTELAPAQRAVVVMILCGGATVIAGLFYLWLGRLRLGSFARLLPYPVISGYNAGSGWLYIAGALALTLGSHSVGVLPALGSLGHSGHLQQAACCVGLGITLMIMNRVVRHWATSPAILLAAGIGFHLAWRLAGGDFAGAQEGAWLLGPFPGTAAALNAPAALSTIPWMDLFQAAAAPIATLILVGGTSAIMFMTGIELELHHRMDLDRELTVLGASNVAAGLTGGIIGGHSLINTSIVHAMKADRRATGVIIALCCLLAIAVGLSVLDVIPRFAIAALLFANGGDRLIERVINDRARLPTSEWLLAVIVLINVIVFGYVEGVAIGLGLTLMIFAWNYRRITIIRGTGTGLTHRSTVARGHEANAALGRLGEGIGICRLQGYLFFLNATDVLQAGLRLASGPTTLRCLILDFRHVVGMDSSASLVFRQLHRLATQRGFELIMTELPPGVRDQFRRQQLATARPEHLAAHTTTDRALQHAEDTLLAQAGVVMDSGEVSLPALLTQSLREDIATSRLTPYLEPVAFAAGDVLIRQGDTADFLLFIERGTVTAQLERPGNPPLRLRSSTAGTIVGEMGLYSGGRRTATVAADSAGHAVRLSRDSLARMQRQDPEAAALLHRYVTVTLVEKLADTTRMLDRATD